MKKGDYMNIDLIAMLKNTKEFLSIYKKDDVKKTFDGKSLIFYSLANTNLDSRYEISKILLNDGVDIFDNIDRKRTVIHVLLDQNENRIPETLYFCKKFIEMGVDVNIKSEYDQTAIYYISRMNKTDEELKPLYDLWFSQPNLDLISKDKFGRTILDFTKMMPYRKDLIERIENYGK